MESPPQEKGPSKSPTQKSPTKTSPTKKGNRVYKKKASIDSTPPALTLMKAKCDNRTNLWNQANLNKLIDYLTKNGFHGEYEEVRKMFPVTSISESGLQKIFTQMSRWAEPIKDDPKDRYILFNW